MTGFVDITYTEDSSLLQNKNPQVMVAMAIQNAASAVRSHLAPL